MLSLLPVEVLSLRDIIVQNSSSYTATTLSSNTRSVEGMPFTDEECALFDARILTIFTHINSLVGNILKELKTYAAKDSTGDEFDAEENALEVLERQLRRDNSKMRSSTLRASATSFLLRLRRYLKTMVLSAPSAVLWYHQTISVSGRNGMFMR